MFYDRKIKYFDYMENGQRLRSGGFAKLEVRDETCYITLQISGLRFTDHCNSKVYLLSGQRQEKLCEISLQQGRGSAQLSVPRKDLCSGISYGQLEAIQIPVSSGRELRCSVAEKKKTQAYDGTAVWTMLEQSSGLEESADRKKKVENSIEKSQAEEKQPEEHRIEKSQAEEKQPEEHRIEKSQAEKKQPEEHRIEKSQAEEKQPEEYTVEKKFELEAGGIKETKTVAEEMPEPKMSGTRLSEPKLSEPQLSGSKLSEPRQIPLQGDKWKQLSAVYPHMRPFEDDREYLSVGPGDFVILSQKYYRLVNNSFLLHGFYNYKHLILTCMEMKGEKRYYIGVPGNFYEREKQVALMFGFESFECREEPARLGDFGYYMIRVEI